MGNVVPLHQTLSVSAPDASKAFFEKHTRFPLHYVCEMRAQVGRPSEQRNTFHKSLEKKVKNSSFE